MRKLGVFVALFACLCAAAPCPAGETLANARKRGVVRCGVSDGVPGFSTTDAAGVWAGMDVDYCRAVAAAVLGDPGKTAFLPLASRARFTALLGKEIDLLARNTTWSIGREVVFDVEFVGTFFLTGQAFLVRSGDAPAGLAGLDRARVAVIRGSTHVRNLDDVAAKAGVAFEPVLFDTAEQARDAFFSGDCRALTGDGAMLAAWRALAEDGSGRYALLPELYSKEPLSPVVRRDDGRWLTVLRAVLAVVVAAEECGLTRDNVREAAAGNVAGRLLLERAESLAGPLGLEPGWAVRAIAAVGNYGEIFERNVGAGSSLRLDRGINRLWKDGGLLWSPPF